MIKTFKCKETEKIFKGKTSTKLPQDIQNIARRKLRMISAACNLNDLRIPPGNKLESLSGDRKGQHSIRINDQYRICFVWQVDDSFDVEITDYH